MRPGSCCTIEGRKRRRIGQWTVPEPAIYEVGAIDVKLSARQNRRRWRSRAANSSVFTEIPDRPAIHVNRRFVRRINVIWVVQSLLKKYSVSRLTQISRICHASRLAEGRFAIVTDVERGMRWTLMRRKTNGAAADGEVVWS